MFRSEMSSQERPSLDGMAEEVLSRGRRARRARTVKMASTVFAAAAAIAVAVAVPTTTLGHATATHPVAKSASLGKQAASPGKPATKPSTPTAPTGSANASPAAGANPSSAAALLTNTITPVGYIPSRRAPRRPQVPRLSWMSC